MTTKPFHPSDGREVAPEPSSELNSRRSFLKGMSGMLAAATATFGVFDITPALAQSGALDAGAGDIGILNLAYALEQVESAFYQMVLERPYRGMGAYEAQIFEGIRNNETSHREFFRTTLGSNAIPDLPLDFSRVNFGSRSEILNLSRAIEDAGVSAFNGAGPLLTNPTFLAAAGSIVSVEARQAALIRDMIRPRSTYFSGDDVVDAAGLEQPPRVPSQVLAQAPQVRFVRAAITASQLP